MQEQLDQACIDMLPLLKCVILSSSQENSHIMKNITLIESVTSKKKLAYMTNEELEVFQRDLLKKFKWNGWTK